MVWIILIWCNSRSPAHRRRKHGIQCDAAVCGCLFLPSGTIEIALTYAYRYRSSSDRFSLPQQPSRNVTQIMYPPNGFPIPPQPNQAMLRPQPHLSYPAWHINGTATPKSFPLQRRNTVLGDVRSQPSDIPASRPLSMTAQTIRSLGLQDPRFLQQSSFDAGEYLTLKMSIQLLTMFRHVGSEACHGV